MTFPRGRRWRVTAHHQVLQPKATAMSRIQAETPLGGPGSSASAGGLAASSVPAVSDVLAGEGSATGPPRQADRLLVDALRASSHPADDRFHRLVQLAQRAFGVKMAAVNLLDDTTQTSLAIVGTPAVELPRSDSFCDWTVQHDTSLVVPDARLDPRFSMKPSVTGDPHLRFYAGEPLAGPGGTPVGALCVFDDEPREVSEDESRLLRDLADWVEKELIHDSDQAQAREVQRRLLPAYPIVVPGYELAGRTAPARNVGGDFFDWQALPGGTVQVVLADVMGKGLTAAVVAAGVRAVMRGMARFNGLGETVGLTAASMDEDLSHTGTFVTMFAARLFPATGDLEYVDAGHGLALVVQAGGEIRMLTSRDLPLGAVPGDRWQVHQDRLEVGDTLLMVSDGILDLFPDVWSAVQAGVALCAEGRDAQEMVDRLAVIGGEGPLDDDITVFVVRRDAS
ncbi:PP2C family protein-serine/threonine phosphatase [Nocardioides bigeumensis]|uniref:GAF domain-containing protein n=1 Tax=Nocardioides bigeumensis TaxID=433657 RepID=A0ABN2YN17_9ACTN